MPSLRSVERTLDRLRAGEPLLQEYLEGDIIELFEVLAANDKLEGFQYLVTYVYDYDSAILSYMLYNVTRFPIHPPPYAKEEFLSVIHKQLNPK